MKKRLLSMILVLSTLLTIGTVILSAGPTGGGNPPVILPTSAPITFPFDGEC
ncbi:MAG: hypothetical protein FWE44_01555 [Defluviitaleaceae bacterium]|nr:hypothetical protein [Defluviitaleaceae bacterium]